MGLMESYDTDFRSRITIRDPNLHKFLFYS